jgi:hypothetical protein
MFNINLTSQPPTVL